MWGRSKSTTWERCYHSENMQLLAWNKPPKMLQKGYENNKKPPCFKNMFKTTKYATIAIVLIIRRPLPARGSAPWEGFWNYNNDDNNNNNNDNNNNNNSNLFAKPCCSPAAEVSCFNGFFDAERRNLLVHGIAASRYWNHVKTVGLWAWRNQNVTKTLYSGFKRNVWHRRWAKGGLKMVFVSRPGHAVSPFWVFFSRCQRSSMSTTSTSLPKPALSHQNLIIF